MDSDQKDQLIEVIEKLLADKTTVGIMGRQDEWWERFKPSCPSHSHLLALLLQLVAGSVVMAFEEVCPERIDLIHKNYRKLCNLLIDVEEWGQVVIISMLTRYARTQFLSPTQNVSTTRPLPCGGGGRSVTQGRWLYTQLYLFQESLLEENPEKAFYGSEEDEAKGPGSEEAATAALPARKPYVMDPDHRLLLRNTKPLLQSRSAAVVMAVAQLYFHLAPKAEVGVIAKALVRLLRSHRYGEPCPLRSHTPPFSHPFLPPKALANLSSPTHPTAPGPNRGVQRPLTHPLHSEVQYVVLQNVATMSIKRRVSVH